MFTIMILKFVVLFLITGAIGGLLVWFGDGFVVPWIIGAIVGVIFILAAAGGWALDNPITGWGGDLSSLDCWRIVIASIGWIAGGVLVIWQD